MKKFLNKIKIHPLFIITIFVFVLIGKFKLIFYYTLLLIIHEIGHILTSLLFNWNIKEIMLLPFGGLIKFNEKLNKPLIEELLISISGIIIQYIFYLFTCNLINYEYYPFINYFIIIFNLMPIYPLDGSKILNVVFNYKGTFYRSLRITILLSYILINIIFIITFNINKMLSLIIYFLLIEVYKLDKNKEIVFDKFLLERYLYDIYFKKRKTINNIKEMKRDYKHILNINNKYITEREYLKKRFDK